MGLDALLNFKFIRSNVAMALEAGTYIDDLVSSNPPQSDSLTQAAGHLRLIKATLLATFPNITEPVTATAAAINAASLLTAVPSGAIHCFAGATLPDGYLWCNGASVLRADYAALFTAIGTTYGTVDGTHFTLPNLKDRFPIGKATMGGTADAAIIDSLLDTTVIGSTYDGEGAIDTITLTTTEMPAHTHSLAGLSLSGTTDYADTNHYHAYSGTTGSGGVDHTHQYSDRYPSGDTNRGQESASASNDSLDDHTRTSGGASAYLHTHTFSGNTGYQSAIFGNYTHAHTFSGTTGAGTSGSNGTGSAFTVAILPPSLVVNYIIKT